MSLLERQVARMFCIGFDGADVPQPARQLIARGVRSAVLFARNVNSPRQVAQLCAALKGLTDDPLLTCIDQEGGRVRRLRDGFTHVPSMRALGRTGSTQLAHEVGRLLARELRAVNIDLNFAPALDVDTNPDNPVIGDRSLGTTPQIVSSLGTALIRGMQENGVAACGKHFPGHGDTSQDSHHALPRLVHPLDRLEQIELPPFYAAVAAGVATIMTAHVIFEPIDPLYPSTMSQPVLEGILRQRMKFDGVIVSDDLEMKAIASHFPIEEVVVRAVNAGVDLLAICHDHALQNRAIDALLHAVESGAVSRDRILASNRRLDLLTQRYARPAESDDASLAWLNSSDHRAIVSRIQSLKELPDPTAN